jgi:hypothetical protein
MFYLTNNHEALEVPLTTRGPIIKHTLDDEGHIASSEDLTGVADIAEHYPEGRQTPLGFVKSLRVSTDGSVQYTMDPSDPYVFDAREFITPKMIRVGNDVKQLTFAQHLKTGGYRLKFSDATQATLTDQEYSQLIGN